MNKKLILQILSLILFVSCISERERKINGINDHSKQLLDSALSINPERNIFVGIETYDTIGLINRYMKIRKDSAELGLAFVVDISEKINKLNQKKDSIHTAYYSISRQNNYGMTMLNPNWSEDDCRKIKNRDVWIGMSLDMLICERGFRPHKNQSNYGDGRRWQWYFEVGSPSYFYGGDDEIITAYN